eukprot:12416462-Karenia_brevis.AAC.1
MVVSSLMLSRGLYNSGVWPVLTNAESGRVCSVVMKAYRNINPDPFRTFVRFLKFASWQLVVLTASAYADKRSWLKA